ncbi:MAG: hypothetical protein ABR548_09200 [Actinomycetota bacterium]|nr:hypothetical protein [Actinomycetota bacterium]
MRKALQLAFAAVVVAAVSVTPGAFAGKPTSGAAYKASDDVRQCDGGTITYHGPTKLWPPNHKYAATWVLADATDDTDQTTLESSITNSQYDGDTEANGSGHTLDDVVINPRNDSDTDAQTGQGNVVASSTGADQQYHDIKLRAERAGTVSDARTYTLTETATFGDNDPCTVTFTVQVPHDMRPSNR